MSEGTTPPIPPEAGTPPPPPPPPAPATATRARTASAPPGGGTTAKDTAKDTASDKASRKAGAAADDVRKEAGHVAETARQEAGAVAAEARKQVDDVVHQAREELHHQADAQAERAAHVLDDLSRQLATMAEGAENQDSYAVAAVDYGAERVGHLAHRLQEGGVDAAVDDLRRFARRRPGLFLASAFGAGFAVARLLRNADTARLKQAVGAGDGESEHPQALPRTTTTAAAVPVGGAAPMGASDTGTLGGATVPGGAGGTPTAGGVTSAEPAR